MEEAPNSATVYNRGWSPTEAPVLPETAEPPGTAASKKRTRKTAEQWTGQVVSKRSMRVKYHADPKGDTNGSIFAIGADPDHPNDQQVGKGQSQ